MSSLIMEIVYGYKVKPGYDALSEKFKKVSALMAETADAGGSIIDICPTREPFIRRDVYII